VWDGQRNLGGLGQEVAAGKVRREGGKEGGREEKEKKFEFDGGTWSGRQEER
jgi:hypothetical protein